MTLPLFLLDADDTTEGVQIVSLVDNPAIERQFQAFKENPVREIFKIKSEDRRIVSGPLMVANMPIFRRDSAGREYEVMFTASAIERLMYKFQKNGYGKNVNLMHETPVDGVFMFESLFIDSTRGVNTPDGFGELPDGSWWGSYKVDNDQVWEKVKDGTYRGFSVEGYFISEYFKDVEDTILQRLRDLLQNDPSFTNGTDKTNSYLTPSKTKMSLTDKLKAMFSKDEIAKLKTVVFGASDNTEGDEQKMETTATLVDGVVVAWDGELVEGTTLYTVTEQAKNPAPEGVHTLTDGTEITCDAAGVVTAIKPAEEKPTEDVPVVEDEAAKVNTDEAKKLLEEIQNQYSELKRELASVKNELQTERKKTQDSFGAIITSIEKIGELPSDESVKTPKADNGQSFRDKRQERLAEIGESLNRIKK